MKLELIDATVHSPVIALSYVLFCAIKYLLLPRDYAQSNNYHAKVIIIKSQNKSFAAIIIEFISRGPKGREK